MYAFRLPINDIHEWRFAGASVSVCVCVCLRVWQGKRETICYRIREENDTDAEHDEEDGDGGGGDDVVDDDDDDDDNKK